MGILDDAIKEHLDLKRQHGAAEAELKQLEDEAFGASERPGAEGSSDSFAEAPTAFMSQPDLAEAPKPEDAEQPPAEEAPAARRPRAEIADLQEAPPVEPEPAPEPNAPTEPEEPAEEQDPAMEHEAIPEPVAEPETPAPEPSSSHSTEEREAIAEQPTEMFDLDEELGGSEAQAPSEEELVEEEMSEPRLAPVDPLSAIDEVEEAEETEEEADDFFDEKRLSDELDQALEAPTEDEDEFEPEEEDEPEAEASPSAPHEEDVLEETPDFLEEAPEDDQLWFEQKPPKDFDFDD